jgi:hypothetical protein
LNLRFRFLEQSDVVSSQEPETNEAVN